MMVNAFHLNEAFVRARARHELRVPPANMKHLPFDVFEFMEYELPWEMRADPDLGK